MLLGKVPSFVSVTQPSLLCSPLPLSFPHGGKASVMLTASLDAAQFLPGSRVKLNTQRVWRNKEVQLRSF